MKNEKTRGTMLTSTALILCCVTFGAGFLCGDLVSEYRRAGVPAVSVQAPQAVQHQPAAEAEPFGRIMVAADNKGLDPSF